MVTVILLVLSTSVGSVISVIPISDVTSAACPTVSNDDATFFSVTLARATICYRKEEGGRSRKGAGEEGEGEWAGEEGGGEGAGEEGGEEGQERKGKGGGGEEGEGEGQERKGEGRGQVALHCLCAPCVNLSVSNTLPWAGLAG